MPMPDSPNFLSAEQREAMALYAVSHDGKLLRDGVYRLFASHAEADRREAKLREEIAALEKLVKRNDEKTLLKVACEQLAAKDAEIAAKVARMARASGVIGQLRVLLGLYREEGISQRQENERLRAALKAADLEHMNAVCDGAYYKPDETRMKIFRDGLREALAATQPAKEKTNAD